MEYIKKYNIKYILFLFLSKGRLLSVKTALVDYAYVDANRLQLY